MHSSRSAPRTTKEIDNGRLYFEDFAAGLEFHHELSRTVTEMDDTMFSLLTVNPQPLHIDAHSGATR
jgi:acyl dehydratase